MAYATLVRQCGPEASILAEKDVSVSLGPPLPPDPIRHHSANTMHLAIPYRTALINAAEDD